METAFRFTKRCLVYGWATKLASIKTKKQKISVVQQGSKHDKTMNERR